jgi:putative RNA 2'-phosphotransferase
MVRREELSKAISHALRHEPWLYELELDDEGWADLNILLAALRERGDEWQHLSHKDVEQMIAMSAKRRHEIEGGRIRALYGHSVPGKLRRERGVPPATLFHGTSPMVAEIVMRDGLRAMTRQYVHLSTDPATALEVGRRKSRTPVLLHVDAGRAHENGVAFYIGNDKVWLADEVPVAFVRAAPP